MWYPKATKKEQTRDGGSMVGGPSRGTIHTLEGTNMDSGAPFYHIGMKVVGSSVDIVQWRSFDRAARSLKNGPDPIQTNRQGVWHPQLCIIGFAKDSPKIPDVLINEIAEFIIWCNGEMVIPIKGPPDWCGSEGYGTDGDCRFSLTEWSNWSGWNGHQHVPDSNDHWDPGKLPWNKIETRIEEMLNMSDTGHDGKYATVWPAHYVSEPQWSVSAKTWQKYVDRGGTTDPETGGRPAFRYDIAWYDNKFVSPLQNRIEKLEVTIAELQAQLDALPTAPTDHEHEATATVKVTLT